MKLRLMRLNNAKEFEYRFNARNLGVAEMFDDLTTNF
jgi:hypothetical protein